MSIFNKIFSSMLSQNFLGWIVIFLIVCIFTVGIATTIFIKKYYKELLEDLSLSIKKKQNFHYEELNKIVNEFSKSTTNGTDNINTEVIIEKNINKKIIKIEGIFKVIPSTLIGLGLLGTFLGLILAIFETKGALTGIENINTFSNALQNPIASMATAFWTSIFGVIGSLILNFINQSIIFYKDEFYNEIENYLDNEIFAKRAKTFNTIFEEFSVTVKTTMLTLTEEMTVLFKNGVEELVNKINSNSLDLTNSAEALKSYTEKFKSLVESMDNTVENFNKPVLNFGNSVVDFINISESLENKFNKSFDKFDNTVKSIDNTMQLLGKGVGSSVETLSVAVHKSSEDITKSLEESNKNLSNFLNEVLGEFSEALTVNARDINENFKSSMAEVALEMNESFSELKVTNNRNIEQLDKLGAIVRKEGKLTEERANRLTELMNTINKINEIRENENFEQMEMLKETFNDLKDMMLNLKNSIGSMNNSISEQLATSLDKNLNEITKELSKDLSEEIGRVIREVNDSVNNLNESIAIIGELVKASNDWASAVAYTLNEGGSDKLI